MLFIYFSEHEEIPFLRHNHLASVGSTLLLPKRTIAFGIKLGPCLFSLSSTSSDGNSTDIREGDGTGRQVLDRGPLWTLPFKENYHLTYRH